MEKHAEKVHQKPVQDSFGKEPKITFKEPFKECFEKGLSNNT